MDIPTSTFEFVGNRSGDAGQPLAGAVAGCLRMQGRVGLEKIVGAFLAAGMGRVAESWIGPGANMPISGEDVVRALGIERVRALADSAGLAWPEAARQLALLIPPFVDFLTPDGRIPGDALIERGVAVLESLMAA